VENSTPIDTTPPNTTITSGPSGVIATSTPSFAFTSSEPGSTFQCRIDAGAFASCSSPFTASTLSEGPHVFEVRAIDSSGNVDPTPAAASFTVDLPDGPPPTPPSGGSGGGGSPTSPEAPRLTPAQAEFCRQNALVKPLHFIARYVVRRGRNGVLRPTKVVKVDLGDRVPNPNDDSLHCQGRRTISLFQKLEGDDGRMRRNSKTLTIRPDDEDKQLSLLLFRTIKRLPTFKAYRKRDGRARQWAVVVTKTWDPVEGPTARRTFTLWVVKHVHRKRPLQRVD
jgi:hypothetical protein